MNDQTTEPASFEGNAQRSAKNLPYHLIPMEAIQAIAGRFQIGAAKYGEDNWKKGGPEFFKDAKNHLYEHMLRYVAGDVSEDNLGAVLWNASALLWWDRTGAARWQEGQPKT